MNFTKLYSQFLIVQQHIDLKKYPDGGKYYLFICESLKNGLKYE